MAPTTQTIDRMIKTDVLVVGGGAAGAMAAVAAAQRGCKVTLTLNGALGRSGNTIMAIAAFRADGESAYECGETKANRKYTRDIFFENIVKDGYYLSEQDLVQCYVQDAAKRISQFLNWGKEIKQRFMFIPPGTWLTTGKSIGLTCRHAVKQQPNIELLQDTMVQELLVRDGKIVGALGLDVYSGELVAFASKVVVLATGGYEPYSFKCSHSDMTGDGLAMALRAGASLADMEFLLHMPGVLLSPRVHRGSILPFVLHVGGLVNPDITDANRKRIRGHIPDDLWEMAQGSEWMKLIYSFFWSRELLAGKGTANGGLYFDFSKASKIKQLPGAIKTFFMLKMMYRKNWRFQGEDMRDLYLTARKGGCWEVGLSNQYTLGGIVVDTEMSCGLPGLFAAGEVTSGLFGANRVASALTEAIILGHRAGCSAAGFALDRAEVRIDHDQLGDAVERMTRFLANQGEMRATDVRCTIERAADAGFALIRDAHGLESTLKEIVRIREEDLPQIALKHPSRVYNLEWIQALHTENLLTCTEAGIRAAIERSESRGFHIRNDFPEVDNDRWIQRIFCNYRNGRLILEKKKPAVTRISPPPGRFEDVMAYASHRKQEMAGHGL